jgi:hypothetical protein
MQTFNEWMEKQKVITITCRDNEDSLENLLRHIQKAGNVGHSFSIIVDPKSKDATTFGWDGDGADRIEDINVK